MRPNSVFLGGAFMAHKINQDTCEKCGACAGVCPVEAIAKKNDAYVVDGDVCIDCCACEGVCPTASIKEAE